MLSNLKIGHRLAIGFGLVILLTSIVGLISIIGMTKLADVTLKIYEHPYAVSNSARDIDMSIMAMQGAMKEALHAKDEATTRHALELLDKHEQNTAKDFDIIFERFLGDKQDVVEFHLSFKEWGTLREEIISLKREGRMDEALALSKNRSTPLVLQLEKMAHGLIEFANQKSEDFRRDAETTYKETVTEMIVLLILTLGIGLLVSIMISRSVTLPLTQIVEKMRVVTKGDLRQEVLIDREDEVGKLANSFRALIDYLKHKAEVADKITRGDLSQRVKVLSDDDQLAISMNTMIESLRSTTEENRVQNWLKSGQAELGLRMRGDHDVNDLSQKVISFLSEYLYCQMGALYLVPTSTEELRLSAGYARDEQHELDDVIPFGRGLVGQVAVEKRLLSIVDIPQDYVRISSALGDASPRHLLVMPLLLNDVVIGVIELASLSELDSLSVDFVESIGESVAIAINSANTRERLSGLLLSSERQAELLQIQQDALKRSNEELEEHAHNLQRSEKRLKEQQEELQAANEELEEQTTSLTKSEERLKRQQEELQASNEELEIKSESLVQQNREIARTGKELELTAVELSQSSRYKSEFMANMSHELRTPLNSLLLLARVMSDNEDGNLTEEQIESAQIIYNSGNDLLSLINDILDLSKIEAGQMGVEVSEIHLGDLAERMKRTFSHICLDKGLALDFEFASDLPEVVKSDSKRLDQIIKNLISNSIKFTIDGSITVVFGRPEVGYQFQGKEDVGQDFIRLSVVDTGIGISEEKQNVIFEAFQQADGSTARLYGGTGLGLSISKELTRLLGGEMRLQSEVGKGSTFHIYLPVEISNESDSEATARTMMSPLVKPQRDSFQTATLESEMSALDDEELMKRNLLNDDRENIEENDSVILLVEDDLDFSKVLLKQCRDEGFKGIATDHGRAALLMAQRYQPDAVVLDLGLPGMDGMQLLDCLKETPETRHIPVHIVSAHDSENDVIKRGAIGFLQKPVDRQQLVEVFGRVARVIEKGVKDLLLVEDDTNIQQAIITLIGNGDVKITTAASGHAALEAIKGGQFDCMILDLGLPDMSGFELLADANSQPEITVPPVIIYTGRELTREETDRLREFSQSIIIKGVRSEERLLDETALFLHRVVGNMTEQRQSMIRNLHDKDALFHDKQIMIVDDDMRNLFALSRLLRDRGMKVIKAQNGKKCLELLESEASVDLILMDIMMPEMDGYETMRRIRASDKYSQLPMIALTAKAMKNDREKCIAAGASDYLSKPVDVDRLLSVLRVWMYQ